MYIKNDPNPKPVRAKPVNASTGAGFSSGVTCYHIQGTTRVSAANTPNHDGGGTWSYVPSQAETNYEEYAIEFYHASANGYGVVVSVATSTNPIREEVERLYGIRQWPVYGQDVLFSAEPDDNGYATWPSVMYDSGVTKWLMYYTASDGTYNQIRQRKSTDGATGKAWDATGVDCISAGAEGEWDDGGVWCSRAWKEDTTYHMLYTGRNRAATATSVGYATSTDGVTWAKSASNPVMEATEGWEHDSCEVCDVIKVGSTYYLWYTNLTNASVWDVFPAYARKVSYATSTDLTTWTKAATPVFGDSDSGYERQPYHGYYSPFIFKNGTNGYYYLVCAVYGAKYDYSHFEMWESKDPTFDKDYRRRVGVIQTTRDLGTYADREIDIGCFATNDIERKSFSTASGEVRCYFGASHGGTWGLALMTQADIHEALRWTPSIPDKLMDVLPKTRWNRSLAFGQGVNADSRRTWHGG